MNESVTLLFGVHAHQPVGNFPAVIEAVHTHCYRPFLRTLYRFPKFRFSAHFSGWLLDFLILRYPEDIAMLAEMVARGQTELLGGADCEPVLAAIPARDRLGQITTLSDKIEHRFGFRPHGAWLAERIWEPTIVPELADSGIRYVLVDDYHFLCTGRTIAELDGFYTTEENGRVLDIYPIAESLRYRLPFSSAANAVLGLEKLAERNSGAAIYFDDLEKFGAWPETYDWVYNHGWLEQFIAGVLASPHIVTATYADHHARHRTQGVAYLPTSSYSEMNEWTLPAAAATIYVDLLHREKASGELESHRPFLRGGIWRNFFSRYPESNWMHKRMLALSERLAGSASADDPHLRTLLYRAQANDAYWHGLFGGLYLPHLRRSVYRHLLLLESALDRIAPRPAMQRGDLDLDGHEEFFLLRDDIQAVIRIDGFGAIHELDAYLLAHNFGDNLRRQQESYYRLLQQAPGLPPQVEGIASAHDRVAFKSPISLDDVLPDEAPRSIFIDHFNNTEGRRTPVDIYVPSNPLEFFAAGDGWHLHKRLAIVTGRVTASYRFDGTPPARFECELNLAMPSCDGVSGRYILTDGAIACSFGEELTLDGITGITLDDRELKGSVAVRVNRPTLLRATPHFTVSQSEAGLEKIMQSACLTLAWSPVADEETIISLEIIPDKE